jgi:hypothetical protein
LAWFPYPSVLRTPARSRDPSGMARMRKLNTTRVRRNNHRALRRMCLTSPSGAMRYTYCTLPVIL